MFTVSTMTSDDVKSMMDLIREERWNPGIHDADIFLKVNPEGLFCGKLNGQTIAFSSALIIDDTFAFFGLYLVKTAYRGYGYGMELTRHRLSYVGKRCIGLDGVKNNVDLYARIGFSPAWNNIRFSVLSAQSMQSLSNRDPQPIRPLSDILYSQILAFDHHYFPAHRQNFLKFWINQPDSVALGFTQNGSLQGYLIIRPCLTGAKIGPWLAVSPDIAEQLLLAGIQQMNCYPVYIDMPDINKKGIQLAKKLQLNHTPFTTVRMYRHTPRAVDTSGIYGITSLETG
ncbi:hypothetical protein CI610_00387 [invertebrate metagenome]|uniref:N-acetyltransferase domain-containing protein n=1 Tax=invertebrate metagenome TaxID=1711999 RepID=A0A2H9TC05_9ZZZZ